MAQWKLTNPVNAQSYSWPINPSEEEQVVRRRNMESSGNTAGTDVVVQQGAPETRRLAGTGRILTQAMKNTLESWYLLCETQSVYLTDDTGSQCEGIITEFSTTRKRVGMNRRDMANAPHHIWEYRFEFLIIRGISGRWVAS